MPVTAEEKRALNKQGFKVVDIKFAPPEEVKPKRKPRAKKA